MQWKRLTNKLGLQLTIRSILDSNNEKHDYYQLLQITFRSFWINTCYDFVTTLLFLDNCYIITQLLHIDIHYFILLQNHYYLISTCYFLNTTVLLLHYCFIITQFLNMYVHYFKLVQDHYYIITLYCCHVTTHYFIVITVLLFDYCKGTFHYFIIITYLLLLHYVSIITSITT